MKGKDNPLRKMKLLQKKKNPGKKGKFGPLNTVNKNKTKKNKTKKNKTKKTNRKRKK